MPPPRTPAASPACERPSLGLRAGSGCRGLRGSPRLRLGSAAPPRPLSLCLRWAAVLTSGKCPFLSPPLQISAAGSWPGSTAARTLQLRSRATRRMHLRTDFPPLLLSAPNGVVRSYFSSRSPVPRMTSGALAAPCPAVGCPEPCAVSRRDASAWGENWGPQSRDTNRAESPGLGQQGGGGLREAPALHTGVPAPVFMICDRFS